MSNARIATGAVFATVTDTAQAVSAGVNTIASGVHMLNDFVSAQRIKQQARIKVDLSNFDYRLAQDSARENAARDLETGNWLKENPEAKESYDAHFQRISKLLNPA